MMLCDIICTLLRVVQTSADTYEFEVCRKGYL